MRLLRAGDELALFRFLETRRDSSLLMLSNLAKAGLTEGCGDYQGTYAASFCGQDIIAVAAHYWNGMLVLQAPEDGGQLAALALAESGRPLKGLLGPSGQIAAVRHALQLLDYPCSIAGDEDLMALALSDLQLPEALRGSELRVRLARSSELELLANWRQAFAKEALGAKETPALSAQIRAEIARWQAEKANLVLASRGRLIAACAVIADYDACLQVGAVWTPMALRGRGFGRCLIAGALQRARDRGLQRALLITHNPAARRAYRSVGFRKVGSYSLDLFTEPLRFALPKPTPAKPTPAKPNLARPRGMTQEAELANSRGAA